MKKVAIVSCYYHHNYGSMLQAYATQRIVNDLGYDVITIQCNAPITYMKQSKIKYLFRKMTNIDIVRKKIRECKANISIKRHPDIRKKIEARNKKFDEFYQQNIRLSELCSNRSDLEKLAGTYDAVIVGSDMLWHPVNVEHDFYTLSFVPDNVKKISYATSFGTTNIPKFQIEKYQEYLSRFSAISVREQSGISVIKNLEIDTEAQVVLDPTLLFDGEGWLQVSNQSKVYSEKYVLCYFLGVNREHREIANLIGKITGYKIVTLSNLDEFVEADLDFGDYSPYDIGPLEFIDLVRNAEYICTDSFHGSCFSILNHKKFFVFNRFDTNNSQSTNTRIDSLLSLLGLEDRRINADCKISDITNALDLEIDYSVVDMKLSQERNKSIEYILNALKI